MNRLSPLHQVCGKPLPGTWKTWTGAKMSWGRIIGSGWPGTIPEPHIFSLPSSLIPQSFSFTQYFQQPHVYIIKTAVGKDGHHITWPQCILQVGQNSVGIGK